MTTFLFLLSLGCSTAAPDTGDSAASDTGDTGDTGAGDTGSDYTLVEYAADGVDALCDLYLNCLDAATLNAMGITDKASCVEKFGPDLTDTGEGACDFQPDKAEACVAAYRAVTCPAFLDGTYEASTAVCDEVCAE